MRVAGALFLKQQFVGHCSSAEAHRKAFSEKFFKAGRTGILRKDSILIHVCSRKVFWETRISLLFL